VALARRDETIPLGFPLPSALFYFSAPCSSSPLRPSVATRHPSADFPAQSTSILVLFPSQFVPFPGACARGGAGGLDRVQVRSGWRFVSPPRGQGLQGGTCGEISRDPETLRQRRRPMHRTQRRDKDRDGGGRQTPSTGWAGTGAAGPCAVRIDIHQVHRRQRQRQRQRQRDGQVRPGSVSIVIAAQRREGTRTCICKGARRGSSRAVNCEPTVDCDTTVIGSVLGTRTPERGTRRAEEAARERYD
jgi:hypothetical protein